MYDTTLYNITLYCGTTSSMYVYFNMYCSELSYIIHMI